MLFTHVVYIYATVCPRNLDPLCIVTYLIINGLRLLGNTVSILCRNATVLRERYYNIIKVGVAVLWAKYLIVSL